MAEITGDLPGWVKRGVGVSIGTKGQHSYNLGAVTIMGRGILEEVSVLGPGMTPANPGAQVAYVRDSAAPPGGRPVRRSGAVSPLRRRRSPSLLMTDAEFSSTLKALERVGVAPYLVDRASRFTGSDISTLRAMVDEGYDADMLSRLIYKNPVRRAVGVVA